MHRIDTTSENNAKIRLLILLHFICVLHCATKYPFALGLKIRPHANIILTEHQCEYSTITKTHLKLFSILKGNINSGLISL